MQISYGSVYCSHIKFALLISQLARLRNRHEKEVDALNADLEDAYNSTINSANARKINELRGEVSVKSWYECVAT